MSLESGGIVPHLFLTAPDRLCNGFIQGFLQVLHFLCGSVNLSLVASHLARLAGCQLLI